MNGIYGTCYTDLCYGYNAFWADCLPALSTPRPLYAANPTFESPLGEGFEVETVLNVRAAKGALRVWEVPSYELRRIHGHSNLNALRDGWRVVKTIWVESPAISARYSSMAAAPSGSVDGTLPHPSPAEVLQLPMSETSASAAKQNGSRTPRNGADVR